MWIMNFIVGIPQTHPSTSKKIQKVLERNRWRRFCIGWNQLLCTCKWLLTWYIVRPWTPITLRTPLGVAPGKRIHKIKNKNKKLLQHFQLRRSWWISSLKFWYSLNSKCRSILFRFWCSSHILYFSSSSLSSCTQDYICKNPFWVQSFYLLEREREKVGATAALAQCMMSLSHTALPKHQKLLFLVSPILMSPLTYKNSLKIFHFLMLLSMTQGTGKKNCTICMCACVYKKY